VWVEYPCTDVQVINRQTIIARVPFSQAYSDFFNLYFFQTQKSVLVKDSRGYTSHREKAFTLLMELDEYYLAGVGEWMNTYPLWGFIIVICISCPCCLICYCCFKLLWRKRVYYRKRERRERAPEDSYTEFDSDPFAEISNIDKYNISLESRTLDDEYPLQEFHKETVSETADVTLQSSEQ